LTIPSLFSWHGGRLTTSYSQEARIIRDRRLGLSVAALFLVLLAYMPTVLDQQSLFGLNISFLAFSGTQMNLCLIGILGAIGLNILTGYGGLVSLGNAAFFAVGAMVAAFLGVQHGWPFPAAVLGAAVGGGLIGGLIGVPALRVRGIYLILITLGLQAAAALIFLEYQDRYFGFGGVPYASPGIGPIAIDSDERWGILLLILLTGTIAGVRTLLRMREGRALLAVRDNELAAAAMGINVFHIKLKAFAFSSFIVSGAGALYVYYLANASADLFTLDLAITFIAMIILGGVGSLLGCVLGGIVWQLLPPVVSVATSRASELGGSLGTAISSNQGSISDLVFGLIIVVVLIRWPAGLAGLVRSVKRVTLSWPFRG
jgi:branched-chain amino acid transport system permease protein